jgi:translation initiation factor 1
MAKKPLPTDAGPFHNPFADLGAKLPALSPAPATAAPEATRKGAPRAPARAVVRYERKGHGGKEMTRVEHLGLPAAELEGWLKEARHALGCGGVVDGDAFVLQGDQRERIRSWLERRGVGKVTVS